MTTQTIRVEDHERLVHWYLKRNGIERRLRGAGLCYDDLAQAGRIGLMKAIERFDPSRGVTFATYALPWIRATIGREICNRDTTVRRPVYTQERNRRAGVSMRPRVRSLDAPVGEDGDMTRLDLLAGTEPSPDEQIEANDRARLLAELMAEARLSPRERDTLEGRFGSRSETLQEIAERHGITRERVRQIELEALRKLQRVVRLRGYSRDPLRHVTADAVF